MSKEIRILFLIILSYTIYGLSIYLDKGSFIFPFPLNQVVFLLTAIQFTIWNFSTKKSILILLFAAISYFLSFGEYWSIVLEYEQLDRLSNSIFLDVFLLGYILLISVYSFVHFKKKFIGYALLFTLSLLTGYFSNYQVFIPFSFLIASVGSIFQNRNRPENVIWYILLFLESIVFLSTNSFIEFI